MWGRGSVRFRVGGVLFHHGGEWGLGLVVGEMGALLSAYGRTLLGLAQERVRDEGGEGRRARSKTSRNAAAVVACVGAEGRWMQQPKGGGEKEGTEQREDTHYRLLYFFFFYIKLYAKTKYIHTLYIYIYTHMQPPNPTQQSPLLLLLLLLHPFSRPAHIVLPMPRPHLLIPRPIRPPRPLPLGPLGPQRLVERTGRRRVVRSC